MTWPGGMGQNQNWELGENNRRSGHKKNLVSVEVGIKKNLVSAEVGFFFFF